MAVNAWESGLCLKCKMPLITIDDTHLCTVCREVIKKMQHDIMQRKKPKEQTGHRKVVSYIHKPVPKVEKA